MAGLLSMIRAYRHRRGYGVHSPYAYMLVRNVLALPAGYSYYAESQVGAGFPKRERRLRLAWQRFSWRFGLNGGSIFDREISEAELAELLARKVLFATVRPRKNIVDVIKNDAITGVLFHGHRGLIYFPNPKVRFVSYEYRF